MGNRVGMTSTASMAVPSALFSALGPVKTPVNDHVRGSSNAGKTQTAATPRQPFACDRLAFDSVARRRHFDQLEPALRSLCKAVRELPNGYEFEFPSDSKTIAMVAEWAAGERLCCPFFEIQLRMKADRGPFWLRLTGRKGTKEFLRGESAWRIKQ